MYRVTTFYRDQVSALIEERETFQAAQQRAAFALARDETCSDAVITDPNGLVLEHVHRTWNAAGVEQPIVVRSRVVKLMEAALREAAL